MSSVAKRTAAVLIVTAALVAGCTATPAGHPSDAQVSTTAN